MDKVTAANTTLSLGSAVAIGTTHLVALLYARDQFEGPVRYVYTGLAITQGLGLLALTVGQGAALYVAKAVNKPSPPIGPGTRDFLRTPR